MKKGQVTIFIIITIVLLITITTFLIINNSKKTSFEDLAFNEQVGVVKESFIECFDLVYKDSLDFVGVQGGYSREPFNYYLADNGLYLPIYLFNGETSIPMKDFVESELSLAVDDALEVCLDTMENQFNIISFNYTDYLTEVNILEDSVKFETFISISLESESEKTNAEIEFTSSEIKSDLNNMMSIADYYISSQIVDQDFICIDCITELAETFNLKVDILNYVDNLIIISIYSQDESSYPASFNFLEAYNQTIESILLLQDYLPEFTTSDELNLIAPGL